MTIRNLDRRTDEALLLPRAETSNPIITKVEDMVEFSNIFGNWASQDRKPVQTDFAWHLHDQKLTVSEADCICSRELAARLIHLLFIDSSRVTNLN